MAPRRLEACPSLGPGALVLSRAAFRRGGQVLENLLELGVLISKGSGGRGTPGAGQVTLCQLHTDMGLLGSESFLNKSC